MNRFEGKVAIVSGAGPGVGSLVAKMIAQEGASVALGARTASRLEALAKEIEGLGHEALVVPTDITKPADAKNMADRTFERFGKIDILINNAFSAGARKPVVEYTEEEMDRWRASIDSAGYGTMIMCHYVAPYMIQEGSGSIVNVTSMSSRSGYKDRSDFACGKATVNLLTDCLADELGPHGIRVNVVAPGHIWSDRLKGAYERWAEGNNRTFEEEFAHWTQHIALKRPPDEREVAEGILFMASDDASGITAATLDVNGGHLFAK